MSLCFVAVAQARSRKATKVAARTEIGVNLYNYGKAGVKEVPSSVPVVRLETCAEGSKSATHTEYDEWHARGAAIIDQVPAGGVCESDPAHGGREIHSLNRTTFAKEIVEQVEANPFIYAVELLNEPANPLFWGETAKSSQNELAYAELVKTTYTALEEKFGSKRPLVLASYDGGEDVDVTWGEQVWKLASEHKITLNNYVDGITVHPYGYSGGTLDGKSWEAWQGARPTVEVAHSQTGKPVYVTEVGWTVGEATEYSEHYSETEQAKNIYAFGEWANQTGYIPAVTFYDFRDLSPEEGFGIEANSGTKRELTYEYLESLATYF